MWQWSRCHIPWALMAVFLTASSAAAAPITFRTALTPEVTGATGSGEVTVVYDDTARTLFIDASFSGLSGTTTVAHIHCCTPTPFADTVGVAVTPGTLPGFPEGVQQAVYSIELNLASAATYTPGFLSNFGGDTTDGAEAALIAGMFAGTAYFNVHSSNFPAGEIRGFLQPVPEPAALLLLGIAGAAAWTTRRTSVTRGRRPSHG